VRVNGKGLDRLILAKGGGAYAAGPLAVKHGDIVDLVELNTDLQETTLRSLIILPPVEGAEAMVLEADSESFGSAEATVNLLLQPDKRSLQVGERDAVGITLEPSAIYLGLPPNTTLRLR